MDTRKFDDLTRTMALGKSRRSVLKGIFGGVVGGIAIAGRPSYGALAQDVPCEVHDDCDVGICCDGICRDIQCCIDNPDPLETCLENQTCFEGQCVYECEVVGCADDEICCAGVCRAIECCIDNPNPNETCPEGTSCFEGQCVTQCEVIGCDEGECCCKDGSCSSDCCGSPITVLPATGSGTTSQGGAWVAAAAIGGAAAFVAARKVRTPETDTVG